MSDTPRTDKEASDGWSGGAICVSADFARALERELAESELALAKSEFSYDQLANYLTAKLGTKGEHGVFETIDNVAAKLFSPAV